MVNPLILQRPSKSSKGLIASHRNKGVWTPLGEGGGEGGGEVVGVDPLIQDRGGSPTSSFSTSQGQGNEFKVGAEAITLAALEVFVPATAVLEVRLWDMATQTLLGMVEVATVANEWSSAPLDVPATLAADSNFAIILDAGSGMFIFNSSPMVFDPRVSFVTARWASTKSDFPASTTNGARGLASGLIA